MDFRWSGQTQKDLEGGKGRGHVNAFLLYDILKNRLAFKNKQTNSNSLVGGCHLLNIIYLMYSLILLNCQNNKMSRNI